jgi:hypothetical protein
MQSRHGWRVVNISIDTKIKAAASVAKYAVLLATPARTLLLTIASWLGPIIMGLIV